MLQYSFVPGKLSSWEATGPPSGSLHKHRASNTSKGACYHLNQRLKKPRCDNKNKNGKQLETAIPGPAAGCPSRRPDGWSLALSALELGNNTSCPQRAASDTVGAKGIPAARGHPPGLLTFSQVVPSFLPAPCTPPHQPSTRVRPLQRAQFHMWW